MAAIVQEHRIGQHGTAILNNIPLDEESGLHSLEGRHHSACDAARTENIAVQVSPDSQIVNAAAVGLQDSYISYSVAVSYNTSSHDLAREWFIW